MNPNLEEADRPQSSDDTNLALRRQLLALVPGLGVAIAGLAPARSAHAQDAARVQPQAYRVALDNDKVRVLEFNSRPGMAVCGNGMHSHPAHLTVALTAAKARVRLPDGRVFVAENKPGDVFWSEAETHEVENIGGRDVRALIVEIKAGSGKA